jgi:hypothetical protein
MSAPQVIQGTWQELSKHAEALGSKQLTLVIPADDEPQTKARPKRPEIVKTKERLVELLLDGLASPGREMTKSDLDELSDRLRQRIVDKPR